jgi:hypothetical protein
VVQREPGAANALYGSQSAFLSKKEPGIVLIQDTANEHIVQIRELIAILEKQEVYVKTLKTKRVGYVVYEDEYQIVAEPFADMNC